VSTSPYNLLLTASRDLFTIPDKFAKLSRGCPASIRSRKFNHNPAAFACYRGLRGSLSALRKNSNSYPQSSQRTAKPAKGVWKESVNNDKTHADVTRVRHCARCPEGEIQ